MPSFEIISIGNELLSGRTLNTNLQTICKHLDDIGCEILRAFVVRDDTQEISSTLNSCISSDSEWILLSGGLGPTYDDMTLSCVSSTLNLPLKINPLALEMIIQRYELLVERKIIQSFVLTESRKKMATMPFGSIPLRNRVGTAPGILIKYNNNNIVCLPGVPDEMENILIHEVFPLLDKKLLNLNMTKTIFINGISESELAPIVNELVLKNQDVYIKSHPRGINEGVYSIEVVVSVKSTNNSNSSIKLNSIMNQLISTLKLIDGIVITE